MAKPFGSTLFVVTSPFQCLCMFEAIRFFEILDYDVHIGHDKYSSPKVRALLDEKGIQYEVKTFTHLIYDVIPFLFSKHKHYDNIFLGYYYSATDIATSYMYSKVKAQLFFLDDGIQAYSIFSAHPRVRYPQTWVKIAMKIYGIIKIAKQLPREKFFTIFDVKSDKYEIIHNPLNGIRTSATPVKEGTYIIGTNSGILSFDGHSYNEYLVALMSKIKEWYPEEKIYYCPHRADKNNESIFALCKKNGVDIFDTKIAVEYDFATMDVYPKSIIGFNSNALYTLRMIYKEARVATVDFNLKDVTKNQESKLIQANLVRNGVEVIYLL